jgi:hypothetical protein
LSEDAGADNGKNLEEDVEDVVIGDRDKEKMENIKNRVR